MSDERPPTPRPSGTSSTSSWQLTKPSYSRNFAAEQAERRAEDAAMKRPPGRPKKDSSFTGQLG